MYKYGTFFSNVFYVVGTGADRQEEESGGMNMAVIAGAAVAGVLLILGLIIFGIWWKRRKTPSER